MSTLTAATVRRLAMIKYMFQRGLEQSRRSAPLSTLAVLSFHDAAELFLRLACEHNCITQGTQKWDNTKFNEYWNLLAPVAAVTQQSGMDRLNRARNNFKHAGNTVSDTDLEFFRVTVWSFFEDNTVSLFSGATFQTVSLTDLVESPKTREELLKCEERWQAGDAKETTACLGRAYKYLVAYYSQKHGDDYFPAYSLARLPHKFGISLPDYSRPIEQLQEVVSVLSMGVDFRKYGRFRRLTPHLIWVASGDMIIQHGLRPVPFSQEEYDFCYDFVIACALTLQEVDIPVTPSAAGDPTK